MRACVRLCVCLNLCKISVYPVTDTDSSYNRRTIVNTWRRIHWVYATGTQSVENMPPVPSPLRIFHRYPVLSEYSTGTQSVQTIPPVPSPLRIFHRYQVRSKYCTGTQSVQNIQCFPPVPSPFRIFSASGIIQWWALQTSCLTVDFIDWLIKIVDFIYWMTDSGIYSWLPPPPPPPFFSFFPLPPLFFLFFFRRAPHNIQGHSCG